MPEDIFDTLDSPSQDIFDEVYQTGGFGEMPPEIGAGPAEIYRGEEYVPTGPRIDLSTWSPTTSFLPSYGVNVPPAITPSAPLEQPFLLPAPDTRGILERAAAAITPSPETTQAAFDVMATLGPSMPNVPGVAMPSPAFDPALAQRILESPTVPGEAAKATSAVLELLNQQTLDPANIALMAGPAALAKLRVAPEAINIGNRILQAALSGRALAETPEAVSGTAEAIARGAPPSEYVPLGAQAALGLAMGYAGGKGALQGPITLRELTRRTEVPRRTEPAAKPVVEPKVSPSEQAASPAGREMNTFDGGGQIEVLRVEGDKAIVRDLATGQERESKGEIFQTPKRPISEEPASVAERAEVQRQVDELPNNKHIQDALRFNEENGLVTQIRFSDTLNTGLKIKPDSIAVTDTDGTIVINPRAFLDWIKDRTTAKTEEGLRKAIRGVISEEGIHGVIWRLVNQGLISEAEIRALWDNASALQKGFTNLSYTGKWSGRGHNSWQMGHELFRREFQRLMELKPREVEQLRGSERFKAEMLDLAERAIIGLEKVIRPNKELAALIKRTKENIDLAREAVEPPEGSPFPRSLKEEEVLPGITAAEFRPEAPEYVREAEEYSRMPSSDFAVQMRKLPGGVTGQAFEMGKRLKTEEDVLDLIRMRNEIYAKADEVKQQFLKTKDMELLNKGMEIGTQGQYFNEAIQFATGFPESKQEIYRKWGHADYKPSVSISKERFAQLEAEAKQPALVSAEFRPTERATEEDRIWSRLEAASGAELDRMIASMNLKAKMGADYEKGTIPDSTAADVPASQRNLRARAMARIGEDQQFPLPQRRVQVCGVLQGSNGGRGGWDSEHSTASQERVLRPFEHRIPVVVCWCSGWSEHDVPAP